MKHLTIFPLSIFLLALQPAEAITIVSVGGNNAAAQPLGLYQPYVQYGLTPTDFAVSWTQTADYLNVTIGAEMFDQNFPDGSGIVDYELTTAIGPGASFATSGIAQGSISLSDAVSLYTLVTLPRLNHGTYYLVLDSPTQASWLYSYNGPSPRTLDSGVTWNGEYISNAGNRDLGYAPASNFSTGYPPVEFTVSAAQATPEPSTDLGIGAGLIFLGLLGRRRLGKSPRIVVDGGDVGGTNIPVEHTGV